MPISRNATLRYQPCVSPQCAVLCRTLSRPDSKSRRLAGALPVAPEESRMPSLSTADHRVSPPRIEIPRDYNAAHDLVERNLAAGRAGKVAHISGAGVYTH